MTRLGTVLLGVVLVLSACTTHSTPPTPPDNSPPPMTTARPVQGPTLPGSTLLPPHWSSASINCPQHPSQGVLLPVLFSVRYARHDSFDRIAFDFKGPVPACSLGYVDKLFQDGSGAPVEVPGAATLELVFNPADAHYDDGTSALQPGNRRATVNFPVLKAYDVFSDFEGYVHVGVGVEYRTGFRVGYSNGQTTSRFWIDLQH